MNFIPAKSVIMEFPLQKEAVITRLHQETERYQPGEAFKRGRKLRGFVNEDSFEIRLNVEDPGRYLPLVSGKVKKSDDKSIVLFDYRLMPGIRRSLIIWLIVTLLLTVFFIGGYGRWIYGLITFSMGLVQYLLTRENFRLQVARTARMLNKILMSGRKM